MSDEERVDENDEKFVKPGSKLDNRLTVIGLALLALATVLTAWSGFQSAKWSGVQSTSYSQAGARRTQANQIATFGFLAAQGAQSNVDNWLTAESEGNAELAEYYRDRLEARMPEALEAWIALDPLNDPAAPETPLMMPEYEFLGKAEKEELEAEADLLFAAGQQANLRSDRYVFATVIFAVALFFAGIGSSITYRPARYGLLATAGVLVFGAGIWVATMPIEYNL